MGNGFRLQFQREFQYLARRFRAYTVNFVSFDIQLAPSNNVRGSCTENEQNIHVARKLSLKKIHHRNSATKTPADGFLWSATIASHT